MAARFDGIMSGREPIQRGPQMTALKLYSAGNIDNNGNLELNYIGNNTFSGSNGSTHMGNEFYFKRTDVTDKITVAWETHPEENVFIPVDREFKRNKFAGKKVVWSEDIAFFFTLSQNAIWCENKVIKNKKDNNVDLLQFLIPIQPEFGIFLNIGMRVDEESGYTLFWAPVGKNSTGRYLTSFKTGTWVWRDVLGAYLDWFYGNVGNKEIFHQDYKSTELENSLKATKGTMPKLVNDWYRAYHRESLAVWEAKPNPNDAPKL